MPVTSDYSTLSQHSDFPISPRHSEFRVGGDNASLGFIPRAHLGACEQPVRLGVELVAAAGRQVDGFLE